MDMKSAFEKIIAGGEFNLPIITDRIIYYHAAGSLSDQEKDALIAAASEKAGMAKDLDVLKKIADLDLRVHALEAAAGSGSDAENAPEYAPGKWYYTGDRVSFEGSTYVCAAPAGVVCVWSPAEYPAYWSKE